MGSVPPNSIWAQMSYTPPRGRCNHKSSLISGTCACLRFMLHPLKSATSFDCDGCGHHASFHNMENEQEEKIMSKWAEQESSRQPAPKKRKMKAITNGPAEPYVEVLDGSWRIPQTRRRAQGVEEVIGTKHGSEQEHSNTGGPGRNRASGRVAYALLSKAQSKSPRPPTLQDGPAPSRALAGFASGSAKYSDDDDDDDYDGPG